MDEAERDDLERTDAASKVHLRRVTAGFLSILTFVIVVVAIVGLIVAVVP